MQRKKRRCASETLNKNSPKILVFGPMTAHGLSDGHIVPEKTTDTGEYFKKIF